MLKKFAQVLSYVVCTQVRRHVHKQIKNEIGSRKARTFGFRKTSFVHSWSGTYYALLLGYFGLNFKPDIFHCVYWDLGETFAQDSSQKIRNKFFIHHCQRLKEGLFVWNCLIFFPRWILVHWTWNLSRFVPNSVEIFTWNFRKKLFRENFSEIFVQTNAILYQNLWNFALHSEILLWVHTALKKFTQVLSHVVCTQVRRHIHKKITKGRYEEEKQGHFVFGKQFCSLPVWDLLSLTP